MDREEEEEELVEDSLLATAGPIKVTDVHKLPSLFFSLFVFFNSMQCFIEDN